MVAYRADRRRCGAPTRNTGLRGPGKLLGRYLVARANMSEHAGKSARPDVSVRGGSAASVHEVVGKQTRVDQAFGAGAGSPVQRAMLGPHDVQRAGGAASGES